MTPFLRPLVSSCVAALLAVLSSGCGEGEGTPPYGGESAQGGNDESAAQGSSAGSGEPGSGGSEAQGAVGGSGGGTSEATNGGGGGATNGGAGEELAPLPSVVRIMAIGDSVTRATCWRARLWEQLNQSFAGRFDFVGTLSSDSGCMPSAYDRDNQGYSSSLITEIVGGVTTARTCDPNPCPALADLQAAFAAATPDLVLLHFGTNDVWNSRAPADITGGYSAVVDALRAVNPDVRVLAAQIIPMNVTATTCMGCSCAGCPTGIQTLNTQIAAWAAGKATPRSPIYVVDQWTGFDTAVDTNDGVHPNAAGSQKMADAWFEALEPLLAVP